MKLNLPKILIPVTALLVAAPSYAAPDDPISIVVTANRLETPESDVASATTVVSSSELATKQPTLAADALRGVPGLTVTNAGGVGRPTAISIRGTNPGHALVLIDGIEVNDALSTTRSYDFGNLSSDGIERIEVIRGAGSTLYGSDAIGGVINIITKHGSGPARATVEGEYGTFASYRLEGSASGGDSRSNYYFGAAHRGTQGSIEAGSELTTLSTHLEGKLPERIKWTGIGRFSDAKFDEPTTGDPGWKGKNRQFQSKVAVEGSFGSFRPQANVQYSLMDRLDDHSPSLVDSAEKHFRYNSHRVKGAAQGDFFLSETDTLSLGFESSVEEGSSVEVFSVAKGGADSGLKGKSDVVSGAFAQDQWITDTIFAAVGARFDTHQDMGAESTYRFAPGFHVPGSGVTFRGSIGSGFKVPSLYQRFSGYGDPGLRPEQSRSYDFGVDEEWTVSGRHAGKVGATLFRTDFDQLIDFDSIANRYANRGQASSEGLEFSGQLEPFRDWRFGSTYTFLRTRDEATGLMLLRRPAHQTTFEVARALADRGELSIRGRFVGARDDIDALAGSRVRMPGFAVFDLSGRYALSPSFQVFGRIENLVDRPYEEINGFGQPGRAFFIGAREQI